MATYLESVSRVTAADFEKAVAGLTETQAKINLTLGAPQDQYNLEQAISQRRQAATAIDLNRHSAEACHLRSPLDGYVGKVDVVPGQVVDGSSALMEVYRIDPIWVCMDFPQDALANCRSVCLPR